MLDAKCLKRVARFRPLQGGILIRLLGRWENLRSTPKTQVAAMSSVACSRPLKQAFTTFTFCCDMWVMSEMCVLQSVNVLQGMPSAMTSFSLYNLSIGNHPLALTCLLYWIPLLL